MIRSTCPMSKSSSQGTKETILIYDNSFLGGIFILKMEFFLLLLKTRNSPKEKFEKHENGLINPLFSSLLVKKNNQTFY